jgi:diacylglycerol kinase family enzyme
VLAHALGSVADLEVVDTAHRGHAAALACRAMRVGTDVVVAFGGDGTVNEVVNGLLTDGVHDGVPALGVVPAGSTNVFARALGLPRQPVEATGALLEALRAGQRRAISLGRADERWFVFAAGMGFDAAVVGGVERHRRRGRRSTHALYARVGLREYLTSGIAGRRHPSLRVELHDGTCYEDVHFAMVTNTDPWTFVGSRALHPTPQASFDDGLALYARRRMGALGLLFSLARMAGKHPRVGGRGAHVCYDLPEVTLRADEPMPVQVDGDYLGLRDKVRFSSTTRALEVVCALDAAAFVA